MRSKLHRQEGSPITTTLLRAIIIPIIGILVIIARDPQRLTPRTTPSLMMLSLLILIGIWILALFRLLTEAQDQSVNKFISHKYHQKITWFTMNTFMSILSFLTYFITLLKKPFLLSWIASIALFIFKKSLIINFLERYAPLAIYFTIFSTLSVYFLTSREASLTEKAEQSFENIKLKTVAFRNWVYKIDSPQSTKINFFPKDRVPSVIYYALHFFHQLFKYFYKHAIIFLTKYRMQNALLVFTPLVAVFESLLFLFHLLILGLYSFISFSLRILLRIIYYGTFIIALYMNAHNLIITYDTRSYKLLFEGLVITIIAFFLLECLRHLIEELPLFSKNT